MDADARYGAEDGSQLDAPPPGIGDLLAQLLAQTSQLVRQEVALARAEVAEGADRMKAGMATMVIGLVISGSAMTVLFLAGAYLLASVAPMWASAGIIGLVGLAIGLLLAWRAGSSLDTGQLLPRRTAQTVRESAEFLKDKVQ